METLDFRPVLLAWAQLQAEELGAKKCNRKGVGGLIRTLRPHLQFSDVYGKSAARSVQILESHCRMCGKCNGAAEK